MCVCVCVHILFQVEESLPGMLLVSCSAFIAMPPDSTRSPGEILSSHSGQKNVNVAKT